MYGMKLEEAIKLLAGTFLLMLLGLLGPIYAQHSVDQWVITIHETRAHNINRINQIIRQSEDLTDAIRQYIITSDSRYRQRYETMALVEPAIFADPNEASYKFAPAEIENIKQIQTAFKTLRKVEQTHLNAFQNDNLSGDNQSPADRKQLDLQFSATSLFGRAFDDQKENLARLIQELLFHIQQRTQIDIDNAQREAKFWWTLSVSLAFGLLASFAAGAYILVLYFVRPLFSLVATMRDLAEDHEVVEITGIHRRDEIGLMAQSMIVFQQTAEEKRILQFEREQMMQRKIDDAAERFRLLFEGPGVGLLEVDFRQKAVVYNNALKKIIGKPNHWQPPFGHLMEMLSHPDEQDAYERDRTIIRVGGRIVRDARIVLEDGRMIWIRLCAKGILGAMREANNAQVLQSPLDGGIISADEFQLIRLIASVEDITARKMAEETIRLSEARLAALADASQSGVLEFNRKSGEFYANQKYREILKVPDHAPAASFELHRRVHPEDRLSFDTELEQAKLNGHFQAEYRVCRDDGVWIWIREVSNLAFESGDIVHMIVSIVDISDAREAQMTIHAAKAQEMALTAAAEAKDRFFAFMTHELRTPVNAISNYLQLIKEELADPTPIDPVTLEQDIDKMRFAALHLRRLVDNILDVSKLEAGRLELNLEETETVVIINEINTIGLPLGQMKGIQVSTFLYAFPQTVIVDRLRLNQILFNLISNAVKFTQSGSVTIRLYADSRNLNYEVRDTGMGMSEETIAKLFSAYTQGDRNIAAQHGGTGLGLALSLQLARLMGGTIRVESQLGLGSIFTLEMPKPQTAIN